MKLKGKTDFHQLSVRLTPEMAELLAARAEKNNRSMSKEVVQMIQQVLDLETKKGEPNQ